MQPNKLDVNLGGGFLLQYANRDIGQMMGYLIETPEGKTVMIDGGRADGGDGEFLYPLLKSRGGRVDLWLMTHAHVDHFGALSWMLKNRSDFDLEIADLRFTFPEVEWLRMVEDGNAYDAAKEFLTLLEMRGLRPQPLAAGDRIECGGLTIDVLRDGRGWERYRSVNDTSSVLRVHFPRRDVLFLGDLGVDAGRDMLAEGPDLRCDIVQMAHHGQNGVDRAFYEAVQPKICLYCAPQWLWDCDTGGGKGSGPWATLETRRWMEEIGVQVSCPHAHGDYILI